MRLGYIFINDHYSPNLVTLEIHGQGDTQAVADLDLSTAETVYDQLGEVIERVKRYQERS